MGWNCIDTRGYLRFTCTPGVDSYWLYASPLWEIRILGQDSVRILYVTKQERKVVLLHAFFKKTNKTPIKEIKKGLSKLAEIDRLT